MRPALCLFVALTGCGGSDAGSVFDEQPGEVTDSATTTADAAIEEDTEAPAEDTTPSIPDAAPPKMDTAPMCPSGMTAAPEKCPEICNGGCVGDACRILCTGVTACGGRRIDCPPGMKCRVECGVSSCGNAEIRCAETGACDVQCTGASSCGNLILRCPTNAPCSINCAGPSSCGGGQMLCGNGACAAQCTGGRLAKVTCGSSCLCSNKCTP